MDKVVVNEAKGKTFWERRLISIQVSMQEWEQFNKERAQARERLENLKKQKEQKTNP